MKPCIFFILFLLAYTLKSCCESKEPVVIESIPDISIEVSSDYKIYEVKFFPYDVLKLNNCLKYDYYSDSIVKNEVSESAGNQPSQTKIVYYTNESGHADSSHYFLYYYSLFKKGYDTSTWTTYYYYDLDGYLINKKDKHTSISDTALHDTFYTYDEGNLIKVEITSGTLFGSSKPIEKHYTYNNLINLIDLEFYYGPFLGNLNRNLIASCTIIQNSDSPGFFSYEYILRPDGLVEKRTTNNINVTNYEYIIK